VAAPVVSARTLLHVHTSWIVFTSGVICRLRGEAEWKFVWKALLVVTEGLWRHRSWVPQQATPPPLDSSPPAMSDSDDLNSARSSSQSRSEPYVSSYHAPATPTAGVSSVQPRANEFVELHDQVQVRRCVDECYPPVTDFGQPRQAWDC
jgi:hypothetical protein